MREALSRLRLGLKAAQYKKQRILTFSLEMMVKLRPCRKKKNIYIFFYT